MPKPLTINRSGRRATCCYCKRQLTPSTPEIGTSMTWDHVKAESDGGWKRVPCCRKCNHLKGNSTPDDWFWFIGAHPRWWKTFDTPEQVARAIRAFRFKQAQAGVRPYRKMRGDLPFMGVYGGRK